MKTNLILLAAILGAGAAYTNMDDAKAPSATPPVTNEALPTKPMLQAAPDFPFTDLKGKDRTLHEFRGRPVILNFWASWCAPCIVEFPQMLSLAQALPDTVFLFLSYDEDEEAMKRFARKLGKAANADNVFIGRDHTQAGKELYQSYKIPETYIIDRELSIRDKVIGLPESWDSPQTIAKYKNL